MKSSNRRAVVRGPGGASGVRGLGRRGFLTTAAIGSTAYLAGCGDKETSQGSTTTTPTCELPESPAPPDLDYPTAAYFQQIAADLDAAKVGSPVVLLDMDRADANIDAIASELVAPLSYRIVEKSLPSLDLLSYVSKRSGSDKLLVMHLPFLQPILDGLPDADILVGKAHLTAGVSAFFKGLPAGTDLDALTARVAFMADGPERLAELVALAKSQSIKLRIAIEIDVGLRRSGLSDPAELAPMLQVLKDSSDVRFAGLLGYDGHVPHTPGGTLDAVNEAWAEATALYQSFVDVLTKDFPTLAALPDLVFNSGGTATFPMYKKGTPVNDVAVGGGVLRPGSYPDYVISMLKPAIFIAAPVIKQYDKPLLPFFTEEQSTELLSGRQGITVHGGRWPAYYTYPEDVQLAPLVNDPTEFSMVPNQGLLTAPPGTKIKAGDWLFMHPKESDALFQFEQVLQVRGGHLTEETMKPFPRRL